VTDMKPDKTQVFALKLQSFSDSHDEALLSACTDDGTAWTITCCDTTSIHVGISACRCHLVEHNDRVEFRDTNNVVRVACLSAGVAEATHPSWSIDVSDNDEIEFLRNNRDPVETVRLVFVSRENDGDFGLVIEVSTARSCAFVVVSGADDLCFDRLVLEQVRVVSLDVEQRMLEFRNDRDRFGCNFQEIFACKRIRVHSADGNDWTLRNA